MSLDNTLKSRFPLWEVVLVVVIVVVLAAVVLGRLGKSGGLPAPDSASAINPTTAEQQAEFLKRLNQPVENNMTPAQEAEFLKRLNQPIEAGNKMTPAQEAEFLRRLNQPAQ